MQHQPSMKQIMAIMAERDAAIHERNVSLSEKKTALAERDMAILQRDSAIAERDDAIIERDNAIDYAIATFQYRENLTNDCNIAPCPPGSQIAHFHPQSHHEGEASYGSREMPMNDAVSVSPVSSEPAKPRKTKRAKEVKPTKRSSRKLKKEVEETTMPVPVCSCTGVFRSCYKWGNSGWQSSCCTTNLSIYPLPAHPNKRHARIGRKMSRSAFNKLLNRLAAEGHDHSNPVDLKEHWAKHGTNRYISIK